MKSFYRLAVSACIALVMLVSLWSNPVKASFSLKSSLSESRIRQLEFQVRSLQNQVSQIQSRSPGSTSAPPIATPPADLFNGPTPQEQFDNLATLVIEINQRVIALEKQLSN